LTPQGKGTAGAFHSLQTSSPNSCPRTTPPAGLPTATSSKRDSSDKLRPCPTWASLGLSLGIVALSRVGVFWGRDSSPGDFSLEIYCQLLPFQWKSMRYQYDLSKATAPPVALRADSHMSRRSCIRLYTSVPGVVLEGPPRKRVPSSMKLMQINWITCLEIAHQTVRSKPAASIISMIVDMTVFHPVTAAPLPCRRPCWGGEPCVASVKP
jgi:hypothetical protein